MNISDSEKLILLMLSELYDTVGVKGEIDPDFIRSAIFDNKEWSIPWMYPGIPFTEQSTPDVVKEVLDILDMWSVIESSYEQLSAEDKILLEKSAEPFGKDPKFDGFDGNNESEHMSTAKFLVHDLHRFDEFKDRYFNSHSQVLEIYRRMLPVFEETRRNARYPFTVEQLSKVLQSKAHPDYRR